jgi:hypothetical protein
MRQMAGNPRVILIAAVVIVGVLGWWFGWFHF